MKSKILKAFLAFVLVSPMLAHSENYAFGFKANAGADGGGALSARNDIDFKFIYNNDLAPSLSISDLNESAYWENGGFILEMSHNGKTVRLNDAIISSTGPLQLGYYGFVEIYSSIDDFFDVDFHPGSSFVDDNSLSYDAFVYGQIDAYNNQKQFQDLFFMASTGDTTNLGNYVSPVPEPTTGALMTLGAMALVYRSKRKKCLTWGVRPRD